MVGEVANNVLFDAEYVEVLEEGIGGRGSGAAGAAVQAKSWRELVSWTAAEEALKAMGFLLDADDHWKVIGIQKEGGPSADTLEKRRKSAIAIVSAGVAHGWSEEDRVQGNNAMSCIQESIAKCHAELPELLKRLKKKKAGKALVPLWQEPSTLLFEYALAQHGALSIALHLSNLQQVSVERLTKTPASLTGQPRVLTIGDTRDLYSVLAQSQSKIEEALRKFAGGGVILWVPEGGDQIPRIMNAIQRLYVEGNIQIHVQFLVPFIPFPECATAQLLLDLWGHPLLHPKYGNMIKEICFVKEATRCVFTRDESPVYAVKNIVSISVQANTGGATPQMRQLREVVVDECPRGEFVYVDVPEEGLVETKLALNKLSAGEAVFPQEWRIQRRSRAYSKTHPRYTILGFTPRTASLEIDAIIRSLTRNLKVGGFGAENGVFVGRQTIFGDPNAILIEASVSQIIQVGALLGECVFVSPHKALCTPEVGADILSQALTSDERLHTAVLRYRRSGPLGGRIFAKPRLLTEHIRAERYNAFIERQPPSQAAFLRLQAYINILNIDGMNHCSLPSKIMQKIGDLFSTSLAQVQDPDKELGGGEWRAVCRDGHWTGKILVQCTESLDLAKLHQAAHGRGVCVDGSQFTIEIASPTQANISAQLFNIAHTGGAAPANSAAASS